MYVHRYTHIHAHNLATLSIVIMSPLLQGLTSYVFLFSQNFGVSFSHTPSWRANITWLVKTVSKRLDVLFAFRDHIIPTQLLCLYKGFICHHSSTHLAHLTPSHQFCLLFDSSSITSHQFPAHQLCPSLCKSHCTGSVLL